MRKALVGIVAVVALVGVACGGDDGGDDDAAPVTADDAEGGGAVTLSAANFAFDPGSLTAAAGDTIDFTNEDDAEHSFTIDSADIDEDVDPNGTTTVDLGSLDPGSYDFYCKYHKDSMTGTLEITG